MYIFLQSGLKYWKMCNLWKPKAKINIFYFYFFNENENATTYSTLAHIIFCTIFPILPPLVRHVLTVPERRIPNKWFAIFCHFSQKWLLIWIIVVVRQQKEHNFYGILLIHTVKTRYVKKILIEIGKLLVLIFYIHTYFDLYITEW